MNADDVKSFAGDYFDGHTAARHPIALQVQGTSIALETTERRFNSAEILPMDAQQRGVQFLHLQDGGSCEFPASPELVHALRVGGVALKKDAAVTAMMHGDWRLAAMALAFLAMAVAAFYVWILPSLAEYVAAAVPLEQQRKLGESALRQVEAQWLSPSELPSVQRGKIQERFEHLTRELNGAEYARLELLIRKSSVGPNAFALPGNFIVLTDELVTLVDGDLDTLSGVLAHELGHLKHGHSLRSVVQSTALTILGSALIGDYSTALAAIPAGLGHLNYSRHFESEADSFSYALLCAQGIDPAKTAVFFDRVAKLTGNVGNLIPSYLSSHPVSEDRAAFFRRPCSAP